MKLTKMTLLLCLIVCGTVLTQTCKHVYIDENTPEEIGKIKSGLPQFYPGDLNEAQAKQNALKQTTAARKLFYSPKEEYLALVKTAALNLINLYESSQGNKDIFRKFIESGLQRQTSPTATAQELFRAAYASKISKPDPKEMIGLALTELMKNMKASPKPSDILAFLGLCGDFGAAIFDVLGGRKKRENAAKVEFAEFFKKSFPDVEKTIMSKWENYSPDKYYNNDKPPQDKGKERFICAADPSKPGMKFDVRSGVMNTGSEADGTLKAGPNALPQIGWPWQTVPDKLKKYCDKEPWAGHFSGSFYELVFMLEFFGSIKGKDIPKEIDKKVTDKAIAWSSAFLIATGMHSSIEVAFPAMLMLQKTTDKKIVVEIKKDEKSSKEELEAIKALEALQKNLCDSSTKFTVDLHTAGTKSKRKLK
jgi:hypothetical protein